MSDRVVLGDYSVEAAKPRPRDAWAVLVGAYRPRLRTKWAGREGRGVKEETLVLLTRSLYIETPVTVETWDGNTYHGEVRSISRFLGEVGIQLTRSGGQPTVSIRLSDVRMLSFP